jgi:AraC-like DNA-binding protein
METDPSASFEKNLVLSPDVRISASNSAPVGGGSCQPDILFNETVNHLDGHPLNEFEQINTFDTFHGRSISTTVDWYCVAFPGRADFNCVEMTMGFPYRDGGWWKSLNVEIQPAPGENWRSVDNLRCFPDYPFTDSPHNRQPFETYLLNFDDVQAVALRVIGAPGGVASFTSLGRLAVYHRDFSRWNPSRLPPPPMPDVFQYVSPAAISDLSESLVKLSGLQIYFPMVEYYLDEARYERFWKRMQVAYMGQPSLDLLLGDTLGWVQYSALPTQRHHFATEIKPEPYVELLLNGSMMYAVAPIVIEGQLLTNMITGNAIRREAIDWKWHRAFANQTGIAWQMYKDALGRSPNVTVEQMEGIAEVMGMIASNIAHMAHRNQTLENELRKAQSVAGRVNLSTRETIARAIDFMEANLEEDIHMGDVAQAVNLSPCYFSTLFAGLIGCSPSVFFARLRIERAKEYLRHTSMSVMDICVTLNYNPSYFNRLFKKMTGQTPGYYSRQSRQST